MVPTQRIDGKRVIESGLDAGELVLIDHLQQARPGMKAVAQTAGPDGDAGAVATRARPSGRRGPRGSRARAALHHREEDGHDGERQEGRDDHAAEDGRPERVARGGAGAARDHERHHAEDERERGHQDRAQAHARRLASPRRRPTRPPRAAACANSTIRIAFLLARPTSITRPIWQKTSFARPRSDSATSAPSTASGTTSITVKGRLQLSYCAARTQEDDDEREPEQTGAAPPAFSS